MPYPMYHPYMMYQYSAARQIQPAQQIARSELYKTQLCKNYSNEKSCKYGNMCQFAHGESEIRPME